MTNFEYIINNITERDIAMMLPYSSNRTPFIYKI